MDLNSHTIFELIGERYLDIQHEHESIRALEAELAARGVTGPVRIVCEYLAASDWMALNHYSKCFGTLPVRATTSRT